MSSSPRVFTFFKGRVALHAILEAACIGEGDEVILPGYTCVVVPNAILYRGAQPVFLDIDPETFNLDPKAVREHLDRQSDNANLKAIIAQHSYGLPADMPALMDLALSRKLLVVEDACHSLGSTIAGKQVGTFGQSAFFSSQWSKPLTTGLGGWARVNDAELADRVAEIADDYPRASILESSFLHLQYLAYRLLYSPKTFWAIQGAYRKLGSLGLVSGSSNRKELDCLQPGDYHKRMGPWQARTLAGHLRQLQAMIDDRRRQTAAIEEALTSAGFPIRSVPSAVEAVWLRYPLRVGNKEELLAKAREKRVELGDWFISPVHPNLNDWEKANYVPGSCPNAEQAAREVVNLSTSPSQTQADVERTVDFLVQHARFPDTRVEQGSV